MILPICLFFFLSYHFFYFFSFSREWREFPFSFPCFQISHRLPSTEIEWEGEKKIETRFPNVSKLDDEDPFYSFSYIDAKDFIWEEGFSLVFPSF